MAELLLMQRPKPPYRFMRSAVLLCTISGLYAAPGFGLEFSHCEIGDPSTKLTLHAECTQLDVPEDPAKPDGPVISLHIAKLAALSNQVEVDPLTILAGGPGQSATDVFPSVQSAFAKLRKDRDIYLIDQRGTGQSNRLDCPKSDSENASDNTGLDLVVIEHDSKTCLNSLRADPRFYTTSIAVQDLNTVRLALGIEQWNIYGISYGTRVGLHYMRKFPESVRTMILDAVVPPDTALGPDLALAAQRALDQMLTRCANVEDCSRQYPDLARKTRELIDQLTAAPREIEFENFNSGRMETMLFTAEHLTLTLRMMSYSSHGVSILPVLLHDAYTNGNLAPLARQSTLQSDKISSSIAIGMHNAVVCTEDQPFIQLSEGQRKVLEQTYLGTTPVDAINASCKNWPQGILDSDFKEPVISDVPVLVLSGGADPVTPPEYGEAIIRYLANGLHIVNPGQGHMQAWLGCMPQVMNNFVTRGNTRDVDFGCLERQSPEPFFLDANGPGP